MLKHLIHDNAHKKANDNNVLFQVMSISFIFINIKCQLLRPYMNLVLGVTDQVRHELSYWQRTARYLICCFFVLFCFVLFLFSEPKDIILLRRGSTADM